MSENVADGTVETPQIDWEARAKKAEAKIVDMKNTIEIPAETKKEVIPEIKTINVSDFDTLYAERKFFESNPDFMEHKEAINEYVSKGLSYEKAKLLVEQDDPTIKNRQTIKQSNFTSGDIPRNGLTFSEAQLSDMSQEDYNRAMDQVEKGTAKII